MTHRIFKDPESLESAGFSLAPVSTLETDPLYQHWQRKLLSLYLSDPYIQSRPPRPYQVKYASLFAIRPQDFPIWDMGVGKSFLACLLIRLWYGDALKRGTKYKKDKDPAKAGFLRPGSIQIIAPRHTLRLTWLDKELKMAGLYDFAEIIDSEEALRHSQAPIWLYSYDFLSRQTLDGRKMAAFNREETNPDNRKGFRNKGQTRYFLGRTVSRLIARQYPPKLLIADEIHRLRAGTERTRCFEQVKKRSKRRIGMTGTPMDGWVEHIATILKSIYGVNTKPFPYNEDTFTKKFTRVKTVNQDWATGNETSSSKERQVPGVNPAQLPDFYRATRHLMHRLMIRDPEVDGQVQFPPVTLHVMNLPMDPNHKLYYDNIRKEQEGAIQATLEQIENGEISVWKGRKTVLGQIQNLRAASSFPWAIDFVPPLDGSTEKIKAVIDICKTARAEGRKVIVFTSFIKTGYHITKALEAAGVGAIRVYAQDDNAYPRNLTPSMRDERIEQFQEADPEEITALVANIALISEGLTLTEASVIINHDHSWRALVRAQGISRVVRPGGRMEGVDVYELIHQGTVDKYVWDMVWAKEGANRALIDREVELLDDNSSELDALSLAQQLLSDSNTTVSLNQ